LTCRQKTSRIRTLSQRVSFRRQEKRSAESTAAMRYAGSFEPDPAIRNPDSLAGRFIRRRWALMAGLGPIRRAAKPYYRRAYPGVYEYNIARTKHIDTIVRLEAAEGLDQLVLLGAGYDTRAYRLREELDGVRVFEVDHPDTSRRKVAAVHRRLGGPPANVRFVEVDFTRDDLRARLQGSGYHPSARTLFVWEGVAMFLPDQAVEATLRFVADHAGPGSAIVFDYILRPAVAGDYRHHGARQLGEYMRRGGEPWIFGLEADEVDRFVSRHGLQVVSNATPDRLEREHLRDSHGELLGRSLGCACIVHARSTGSVDSPGD
jgi:methyltransferase (TIGR00027 family)